MLRTSVAAAIETSNLNIRTGVEQILDAFERFRCILGRTTSNDDWFQIQCYQVQ